MNRDSSGIVNGSFTPAASRYVATAARHLSTSPLTGVYVFDVSPANASPSPRTRRKITVPQSFAPTASSSIVNHCQVISLSPPSRSDRSVSYVGTNLRDQDCPAIRFPSSSSLLTVTAMSRESVLSVAISDYDGNAVDVVTVCILPDSSKSGAELGVEADQNTGTSQRFEPRLPALGHKIFAKGNRPRREFKLLTIGSGQRPLKADGVVQVVLIVRGRVSGDSSVVGVRRLCRSLAKSVVVVDSGVVVAARFSAPSASSSNFRGLVHIEYPDDDFGGC